MGEVVVAGKLRVHETEIPGDEEADELISYEILNYPADTTLKGYRDQWEAGHLVVPPFQRRFVWDVKKSSKLIESFLLGLPVPGVFLFKQRKDTHFLIVDGQQRITSVVYFQRNEFPGRSEFRLSGVAPQWEGKLFSELSEQEVFKIENAVMRATIIQQLKPNDSSSIYHIFQRLNTGGVNLNPMEIRRAIGYRPFLDLLDDLNENEAWRGLLGLSQPDKRLRDVELVLRVLALNKDFVSYEKPMKSFLNAFVEKQKGADKSFAALKRRFVKACESAYGHLGEKPFHLRGRLNYSVLDSVLSRLMDKPAVANLQKKYAALIKDEDYFQAISFNTSDASEITSRFKIAKKKLS